MKYGVSDDTIKKVKAWLGLGSINIFGLPFSGKDTQGKRLAELLDAVLIGGGDIIRSSDRDDIKQIVSDGTLAPQQDYLSMITPYLSKDEYKNKPLVLSSVGRWHGEEDSIMDSASTSGHPQKAVVLLNISDSLLKDRRANAKHLGDRGQRADDAEEHIENRVSEFNTKTKPVIDFYQKNKMLIEVDGSRPPDEVTKDIFAELVKLAS